MAVGWCIEWMQAYFLVADDIMDESITRRGQPCWYKARNSAGSSPLHGARGVAAAPFSPAATPRLTGRPHPTTTGAQGGHGGGQRRHPPRVRHLQDPQEARRGPPLLHPGPPQHPLNATRSTPPFRSRRQ